ADLDARTERREELAERRFQFGWRASGADLPYAGDGKAIPVDCGRGIARLEPPRAAVKSCEGRDTLQFNRALRR
ncbi:hypothetical protein, partial [Gemmatimonas sp.]|uniref:hypothetical protein n=1 Tax=Gemmatimonas sp. TaxID=1962908 RepID=UPI0033411E73